MGPVELSEGGQAATVSVLIDAGDDLTERIVDCARRCPASCPTRALSSIGGVGRAGADRA